VPIDRRKDYRGGRQIMAKRLDLSRQKRIIESKAGVVLDDSQAFTGPIQRGIQNSEDGRRGHRFEVPRFFGHPSVWGHVHVRSRVNTGRWSASADDTTVPVLLTAPYRRWSEEVNPMKVNHKRRH
jgi:hypothetical protein